MIIDGYHVYRYNVWDAKENEVWVHPQTDLKHIGIEYVYLGIDDPKNDLGDWYIITDHTLTNLPCYIYSLNYPGPKIIEKLENIIKNLKKEV